MDISTILKEFKVLTEKDWNKYTDRQNNIRTAQLNTRYIPVIFNLHSDNDNKSEYYTSFISSINKVRSFLVSTFKSPISIGRVLFTELPSGKKILLHKDGGNFLENYIRIHIPLISNDQVKFMVKDQDIVSTYYLEPGKVYALNNCKCSHGVHNASSVDRYHLIVDIKITDSSSVI